MKSIMKDHQAYKTLGRITWVEDTLYLGYSGSLIEFETDSSKVLIDVITDKELQDETLLARFAVYVNDGEEPAIDVMLDKYENSYMLNLDKPSKVRIEKLSEAAFGLVGVKDIRIDDNANASKTAAGTHKIEFIGDSITCGYGVEADNELVTFKTSEENAEKAYAIKTARALGADFNLVSWSGIGIITNWVPEDVNEPLEEILMPHLYKYQDLRLSERLGIEAKLWDAKEKDYIPELIVINIGTNDDSYVRCIADRQEVFGAKYELFIEQVHEANPTSAILCMLGTMGRNLCEEEAARVENFKKKHPDVAITYLAMPEQDKENDGMGADYHPCAISQQKASDILVSKIREFMKNW